VTKSTLSSTTPGTAHMNSVLQSTDQIDPYRARRWVDAQHAVLSYLRMRQDIDEAGAFSVTEVSACLSRNTLPSQDHIAVEYLDDIWAARLAFIRAKRRTTARDWTIWSETRCHQPHWPTGVTGKTHEQLSRREQKAIIADLTEAEDKQLRQDLEEQRIAYCIDASGLPVATVRKVVGYVDKRVDEELDRIGRLVSSRRVARVRERANSERVA